MNGINRKLRELALAALAATALLSQAQAAPVVSVNPSTQTIGVGDPATVDVIVSGLTQALGGFSFVLGFNNTFLSFDTSTNNPNSKMGASPVDLSFGFDPIISNNSIDVFYLADQNATEAGLVGDQGASFTLATVNFLGSANGLSPLTLTGVVLSNFTGRAVIDGVTTRNGEICVGGNCAVAIPEPTSMLLVATALGVLAMRRRKTA